MSTEPSRRPDDWRRMLRYVGPLIRSHPLLEGIRIIVHGHEAAIFVTADHSIDSGGWEIEERIERPEWWMPLKQSHGRELAEELARRVRTRWDERHP